MMNKIVAAIVIGILGIVGFIFFTMHFPSNMERENFPEKYEIENKWELPKRLEEISGMDFIDNNRLACIQDEEGIIFIYNLATKKVEQKIEFGKSGDYEGLALAEKDAYVMRSDGVLFEVANYMSSTNPKVTKHETFLKAKHNVEGLCADLKNNRLLLAVKDRDPVDDDTKGIYAFDLNSKKLKKKPVYAINLEDKVFDKIKTKNKLLTMMPSELNINPKTGEFYVLDARNPKLLILDKNGNAKKVYLLKRKKFYQPEGLAFKANGDLFISNEGHSDPANILEVELK